MVKESLKSKKLKVSSVVKSQVYTVYILRTSANTLYIGQTNNLKKRLEEHWRKKGKSAKYVRSFDSFKLVYVETFRTRRKAMQREYELKQLSHAKKEALIRIGRNTTIRL